MRFPEIDFSLHWPELEDSCHPRYTLCELSANFLNFPHMRFGGWHQAELRQLLAQYVKCSSSSFFCLSPFWQSRTYDELEPMKPIAATSLSLAISLANVPGSGWQELCEISVILPCWAGSLVTAAWAFCLSQRFIWLSNELKKSQKIIIANIYEALTKCKPHFNHFT